MAARSWKELVLERIPAALPDITPSSPTRAKRFAILDKSGGAPLGISTISIPDAWRVAWLNIRDGKPADEGAGTKSLTDLWGNP